MNPTSNADDLLLFLLKHGGHRTPARITTTEIGTALGMSQQNASRRLIELEQAGYVERKNGKLALTQKAIAELSSLHAVLKNAFEQDRLEIEGTILSGLGEGKYYLSLEGYRKQIREKLSFDPFPGTLNIRLEQGELWKRQQLTEKDAVVIKGFVDKERTYGDLFAYRCGFIAGKQDHGNQLPCAIIIPLRTHHGSDILEVISAFDIKKKFGKKDGDKIKVTLEM